MPTYDYVCDACDHTFEEWQSFKDDALTKCPECKKAKLRRLFGGGAAIIFKGSGFYETDYRRKDDGPKDEKATDKSAEKSDSKAESKTESSSETKTESSSESKPTKANPKPKSSQKSTDS